MTSPDLPFVIDRRFNGPTDSGNGGYAAGLIASLIGEQVKIRLQKPLPMGIPLAIRRLQSEAWQDQWQVLNGEEVIATVFKTEVVVDVPNPPSYVDALAASKHFIGFTEHLYPTCFVCGTDRHRGDGLRIFAARVPGREIVAAPWLPDASLGDDNGKVRPEVIWAALDCPGAFAAIPPGRAALLGEFAVHISRLVHVDEPCVVTGWKITNDGRKYRAGTALFDEDGELCAFGHATWIELLKS
jgi:hypothetical protein